MAIRAARRNRQIKSDDRKQICARDAAKRAGEYRCVAVGGLRSSDNNAGAGMKRITVIAGAVALAGCATAPIGDRGREVSWWGLCAIFLRAAGGGVEIQRGRPCMVVGQTGRRLERRYARRVPDRRPAGARRRMSSSSTPASQRTSSTSCIPGLVPRSTALLTMLPENRLRARTPMSFSRPRQANSSGPCPAGSTGSSERAAAGRLQPSNSGSRMTMTRSSL